jgi:hypothetical protein
VGAPGRAERQGCPPGASAKLEPTLEPRTLAIGGTSQLVLHIENRGIRDALDVSAKTRSSLAALHGLTFSFGVIEASQSGRISLDVKLPDDTRGDTATVMIVFSGDGAPAELTQKLSLTRPVCTGKITRDQYDKKRGKLQRTLDAGDMTQDDFDRYDAELLRCLE